jgi:AcrR family transcriptional regulator
MPSKVSARRKSKVQLAGYSKPTESHLRARSEDKSVASDRRTQILQVSARLFAEFGFETTSVRQIADQVSILAGSLYHHFGTKEEILHEILRAPLHRITQDNARIQQLPADAEHRLVASVVVRFHQYVRDWEVHTIILHDSKFFRRRDDFSYVQEVKSRAFRMLELVLIEGMQTGLFHAGIDTYLMIGTISRMLSSAAAWFCSGDLYSANKPSRYTLDNVIDFHLDNILRMLRASSRLTRPIPREACERLILP